MDPLAGKYAHLSPYNYASNNPITHLDVDGMQNPAEGSSVQGGGNNQSGPEATNAAEPPIPEVHSVKKGETLSGIAKAHGTTVEKLRTANNLDPKNDKKLQIGTKLTIPGEFKPSEATTMDAPLSTTTFNPSVVSGGNSQENDGIIDAQTVKIIESIVAVAGGIAQMAAGFALIASGAGAPLGVMFVVAGTASTGFGLAQLATAIEGKDKKIPGGLLEGIDRGFGGNGTIGQIGDLATGGVPKKPLEVVGTMINIKNSSLLEQPKGPDMQSEKNNKNPKDNAQIIVPQKVKFYEKLKN